MALKARPEALVLHNHLEAATPVSRTLKYPGNLGTNSPAIVASLVAQGSAAPTDECDVHSLDNCAADLFVFATRNTVPETEEYIKHAPCLNKVGSSFSTCIKNTIADLDVASRLPPKQRIAGACCQYNKLDECVRKAVESTCPPETLQFSEKVLKRYAGELLGAVCTGFRSGEKCKSIQYDDQPGDASLRSVLTPLIKVGAALQG
ncbi:hypothetical protein HPB49_018295 [Dermacentor silvarum]|uniref:Uncharacterized protein n=1 Tax=Dermacentor silvarum TaxID=543639 RepID=A0ACB8CGN6_DERSI|nr:hypothetical protein HPB49_018295 [Dermacentor silvarum]